jgi:hypothetical protein
MTEEELKQKCKERAKIFQQAMESCHSSSLIDCIEWFADRIAELEKENAELKETLKTYNGCGDWDNDFHTCRVYLQREELQDCIEQLTKATEIIKKLKALYFSPVVTKDDVKRQDEILAEVEQFLNSEVEK